MLHGLNLIWLSCGVIQTLLKLCRESHTHALPLPPVVSPLSSFSRSSSPHLCLTLIRLPSSFSSVLHSASFSLIGLHLSLYPPTLPADIAEGISLSLSRSLSLSLLSLPTLYLTFSIFVSLCLYLSLPPSPSPSLILIPHYLSTHT